MDEKIYFVDYEPEKCCKECNEIIHNHFDCPECKTIGAGTNITGPLNEYMEDVHKSTG